MIYRSFQYDRSRVNWGGGGEIGEREVRIGLMIYRSFQYDRSRVNWGGGGGDRRERERG